MKLKVLLQYPDRNETRYFASLAWYDDYVLAVADRGAEVFKIDPESIVRIEPCE